MSEIESTLPRRQLGRYLRDLRLQSGMTITEAAKLIEHGSSTLQRLEKGTGRVRVLDVEALCRVYGADETTTAAMLGLAQQAKVKSWWHDFGDLIPQSFDVYMGLEAAARNFTAYNVELVPGLLQTADYTRALVRSGYPEETAADHDRRVRMRAQRQILITRKTHSATVDVVLNEFVLRRVIGGRGVMSAQLRHIADLSTRPNVTIRILPFTAGVPSGRLTGPFIVLGFGDPAEPRVVYVPIFTGDMYLEKEEDVRKYDQAFQAIQHATLDEVSSRNMLRQIAREYERER
ncbi:helix-turn-helix domain-containing protein [Nocardia uniformis]|uniref:Helix-turn-helix domain-containing protein n=2 Tax=Nocardia uniformis TaxID=53432 RepID=A0A849C450_9NOCA|nr:helix-turn-helix transcriptional regulator [Nocardia uniformis]NNH72548.1 helix-turn-helix domain-containing protein [Nocardia uniformis]